MPVLSLFQYFYFVSFIENVPESFLETEVSIATVVSKAKKLPPMVDKLGSNLTKGQNI